MSDLAPSNFLPASDWDTVSDWIGFGSGSLPADCIKLTFQNIGSTSNGFSALSTSASLTPFLYVDQPDIHNGLEDDSADFQFEE